MISFLLVEICLYVSLDACSDVAVNRSLVELLANDAFVQFDVTV